MILSVQNLKKSFDTSGQVLDSVGFDCPQGEICAVVGPSGCGKTTLLRIIDGMLEPDSGIVRLQVRQAQLGFMFQEDALLPWRTLFENARLPMEIYGGSNPENVARITTLFKEFSLRESEGKYPDHCSVGMKQRAAYIRTLVAKPKLLLLDEPFSSLDYDIKLRVQVNLATYVEQERAAVVLVTHDIEDAIALADKVIVLSAKPSVVKAEIPIELGLSKRDPIAARTAPKFQEYFKSIWQHLKYLPS